MKISFDVIEKILLGNTIEKAETKEDMSFSCVKCKSVYKTLKGLNMHKKTCLSKINNNQ